VEAPQPRRGVKHRPQPKHGREPIPVPAGQVIYDSLKTSFVDFPRLITTLEKEGYTGYVRLLTDDASGLILFREGSALECMYDGAADASSLVLGKLALQQFNDDVIIYTNYQLQDSVWTPLQVSREHNGRRTAQIFYNSCKFNPGFPESLFTKDSLKKGGSEASVKKTKKD